MYLCEHENIARSTGTVGKRYAHEKQPHNNAPARAKLLHGHNNATRARTGKPDRLYGGHECLEGEDEEEHHEVEARIRLEGFVRWAIPAQERCRCEQYGIEYA